MRYECTFRVEWKVSVMADGNSFRAVSSESETAVRSDRLPLDGDGVDEVEDWYGAYP
jgi:hypothetical protein